MTAPPPSPVTDEMCKAGERAIKQMRKARIASLPFSPYGSPGPIQDRDIAKAVLTAALDGMVVVPREPIESDGGQNADKD
jgi:hypothetical protein